MFKFVAFLLVAIVCVNAATIRWTAAGGTALWDFGRNWDCNCIPTANDDVIIDVPNIYGNVRIAANPAACRSLTVGGSSQFGQSLYVQGQLSVGAGGAVINSNGDITLDSSPVAPLISDGVFSGSNRFFFKSGTLAGKGTFVFESINFTTPALKQINTTTTVRGLLWVLPGQGQNALINVAQQSLTVSGTLRTEEALTIFSDDSQSAALVVTGNLNFNGAASTQYIIRGYASVSNLNVNGGLLTIQNTVDIKNSVIAAGASVTIIGGPENQRNFGTVSGSGTLVVQGGTNTIKGANLATLTVLAGKLTATGPLAFSTASFTGGELAGNAAVNVTQANFQSSTITSAAITAANLNVAGFSTLSGASLTITSAGTVSAPSQFTLNAGSLLSFVTGSKFTQGNPFGLVPGADAKPSAVNNDGTWTSSAISNIAVNVQGKGTWVSATTGVLSVTGVNFSIGAGQVNGSWKFLGVTGTIPSLSGSGYVELNGKAFTIASSSIAVLNHINGQTAITSGSVGNLTVSNGNFVVGTKVSVSYLNFTAGVIAGTSPSASQLATTSTFFGGAAPKFINTVLLTHKNVNWNCLSLSCQIVTNNAQIQTGN